MVFRRVHGRRAKQIVAATFLSGVFFLGLIDSCDDRLVALTTYFDPCGTILSNCEPGFFQGQEAGIGNPCWDPTCTVPGGCSDEIPLGATYDLCP